MYYVCDKKGSKYGVLDTDDAICEYYTKKELLEISKGVNILGVSNEDIKVLSSDFIIAKSKLLGVDLKNIDWIKSTDTYRIYKKADYSSIILEEIYTMSYYTTKENCDLFIKELKIVNLFNNKSFCIGADEYYVVYDNRLCRLEGFVSNLNFRIQKSKEYRFGYIEEVYWFDNNTIVFKYFNKDSEKSTKGTYVYFKLTLSSNDVECISVKDEHELRQLEYLCRRGYICECYEDGSVRKHFS